MRYYTAIITIIFIFSGNSIAAQTPSYGLAMHGTGKYSQTDTHLKYANPDAPKGGELKISEIGTYDTLNPYSIKGIAPPNMNLVYDRLMRRVWDEPFTLYPLIAEKYEIAEDRSWITFHLNPEARFHDDSPITSDDVLYSFETLKEHGRPNMRRIYKLIETIEIKSPREIHFKFGEGYDRETALIVAMMPVLSKQWWSSRKFNSTITEIPLLNGPYKIKSSETGQKITYERVKNYWAKDLLANKGHYNFNQITYEYFRDDTVALESFLKGNLNLRREWNVNKWQNGYTTLHPGYTRQEIKHNRPERAHGFIFNTRRPMFENREVRKALSLAFDDTWIAKNVFHNNFKRIESFFPNSHLDGSKNLKPATANVMSEWKEHITPDAFQTTMTRLQSNHRQNLREASKTLEKAGWGIESGKRVNKSTKAPLAFEIILSTPQEEKIALSFQKNLKRLGIHAAIRKLDSASFQERKKNYDYDMIMTFWQNSLSPGTEQMLYWSCNAAKQKAQFNYSGICNPALDHFAQNIANAKNYAELTTNAHIIDRILLSEYVMIPLFYKGTDYIAYDVSITRPEKTPIYGAVTETWWKAPQKN